MTGNPTPTLSTTFTTRSTTPTTTRSNPQTTRPGSLPTLTPGYLWIRGVTAPNFHYYIQANSVPAVLGTNYGAGQFAVVSGQLTQLTSSGEILYAQVEQKTSADDLLLGLSFASTPNTNGAFAWSGDSLTWSSSGITRPNPAAWYVCGSNRDLFINLGQYLYGTPSGCTDHTVSPFEFSMFTDWDVGVGGLRWLCVDRFTTTMMLLQMLDSGARVVLEKVAKVVVYRLSISMEQ